MGILPGPKKPSHLLSFLEPIIHEIQELGQRGLSVVKNGEEVYNGKVHLMAVSGDIPAIGDMMGSARHMSYDGCRVCDTEGVRVGRAMCFPDDGPRYGRIKSAIDLTMGNPVSSVSVSNYCVRY